jgi:8-oxo-dGTP diphosphatase
MELKNKLYKNIGIHVITALFTVEKGITKVLLIRRTNDPFNGYWALPSGAMYNNELIKDGALRELKEKTGIELNDLTPFRTFDSIDRSPIQRMIGIGYIGIIDSEKVKVLKSTNKTSNADWFQLDNIPKLAYDHNDILNHAIEKLKERIITTDILKSFFPNGFTLPELQKVYESILNIKIDRRNFRKKMLNVIIDTGKEINYIGKKKAKLYKFDNRKKDINIF